MEMNVTNNLPKWNDMVTQAAAAALYEEATRVFTQSQSEAPFDQGPLRQSGTIHPPSGGRGNLQIKITYGGQAKAYAWVQHERLDYNHPRGGKAKYLEGPMTDAARGFAARMAADIKSRLPG